MKCFLDKKSMGLILTLALLKGWFKKLGNPTNRNWLAQDQLLPFLSALNSESQDGAAEISMICFGMGTWGDNTLIEMFIDVPLLLSFPTGRFSLHVPMNLWQSAGFPIPICCWRSLQHGQIHHHQVGVLESIGLGTASISLVQWAMCSFFAL